RGTFLIGLHIALSQKGVGLCIRLRQDRNKSPREPKRPATPDGVAPAREGDVDSPPESSPTPRVSISADPVSTSPLSVDKTKALG
ncbi:hypothetical protein NPIL_11411, partial [Nephila pilipes]